MGKKSQTVMEVNRKTAVEDELVSRQRNAGGEAEEEGGSEISRRTGGTGGRSGGLRVKRRCRGVSIKESENGSLNKVRRVEEEQPRHCVRRGSRHTI